MTLRRLIVLACTLLMVAACVVEPYGGHGGYYGGGGGYYGGNYAQHDYGRRVWHE